ncbi:hypothetical protein T492DRAFT_891411 [Pavlovales sp. CCMP2436]|nr:hypothetical protein T492DRAFT_891411 [Pavlovales sp. CCMP2436]
MASDQSETDGGAPPMRHAADALEGGAPPMPRAAVIGVVAVSTASAVWYLERGFWQTVDTGGTVTYYFSPLSLLAGVVTGFL